MLNFGKTLMDDIHYRIFVVLSYKVFVRLGISVSPACSVQAYRSETSSQSLLNVNFLMVNGLYGVKKNHVRKTQKF